MSPSPRRAGWRALGEVLGGATLAALGALVIAAWTPLDPDPVGPGQGDARRPSPAAPPPLPAGESSLPPGPATVTYRLDATLDPVAHRVAGQGTVVWRNTSEVPQRELWLHLYLNAFKNDRSVYLRADKAGGFRGGLKPDTPGSITLTRLYARELDADLWTEAVKHAPDDPDDETDVRVELPRAVPPGGALTLELAWSSALPSIVLRTGFAGSFHMVAQWFPKLARLEPDGTWAHFPLSRFGEFYADFGDYDVTVETPAGFVVGATGALTETTTEEQRVVRRFVQQGVHDFAFAAWDGFDERRAEGPFGVELRCLYPRGWHDIADRQIAAAAYGLQHLSDAFGRYPYAQLTLVHPPPAAVEAGGMEYPTLITTGGDRTAGWLGVRSPEGVTVHELAHQWFYGLVATHESRWPFLDEGLTSYAEADALSRWLGPGNAFEGLGLRIGTDAVQRAWAAGVWGNDEVAQPADAFASGGDYGGLVYARTATVMTTLARIHGHDRVREAVGRYARRYRFAHPGPEEFLSVMGEALGQEVGETLREALLGRGWVDYAVVDVHTERGQAGEGEVGPVWTGGALVRRRGTLRFPVDVALHAADGTVTSVTWSGEGTHHLVPYRGQSPLVAGVVDPEHAVLLDHDLLDNARRAEPVSSAPRVRALASAFVHALQAAVGP